MSRNCSCPANGQTAEGAAVCQLCHPGLREVRRRAGNQTHGLRIETQAASDTGFWSVLFLQSGNIWSTKDREKSRKAKKGSQCLKAKAIVAAGIVQKEKKKKKEKASRCRKEMDQSSEIPLGHQQKEARDP